MNLSPQREALQAKCFHPSGTFVEFPREDVEKSVSERFEKIVYRYPNRLAIKTHHRSVTFNELNRVANRIAHGIVKKHGLTKEPIGLLFEDIIDGVAASLAALKIGKPYVALDPSWPLDRLSDVLADSKATLILTNNQQLGTAGRFSHTRLPLFNTSEIEDSFSSDSPHVSLSPDNKTAITYTTGSTGEPKGVIETNRTRLHSTMTTSNQFHICQNDKLSLIHSIYFAAGKFQVFRALLNGASLFPFDINYFGLNRMAEWIRTEEITILYLPVAVFRQLADSCLNRRVLSTLRIVHISGAPITRQDFESYKKTFSEETYFAFHMGSTEAYVMCSGIVDRTFTFPEEGTLAGYPTADKEIRFVDDDGHDVDSGEVGEIAVKSRYLASGYWGKPELTKAKFLPDPAGSDSRIYLTGDLGKILRDGFVVHMGRKDFMVKIRGYRVEPGEVDRLLLTHPGIEAAAVVPWDREDGEKYLAAYFVPKNTSEPTGDALRVFLKARLPDYMVPSVFMCIDSLPLTNGKLDRKRLPEPDSKRPDLRTPYTSPRNELEERLARIWSEVLSVERVGVNDVFLDLGGDSLQAMRIVSRVGEICSANILLESLLRSATVAQMASLIAKNQAEQGNQDINLSAILDNLGSLSEEQARQLIKVQADPANVDNTNFLNRRRFWEKIAPEYTTAFSDIPEVADYVGQTESDHMFGVLKTDPLMEVLDLGCGFARWAAEFGKRCRRVVAVDFSAKMVERARDFTKARGLTNIDFHVLPIQEFSSSDRFDIILLSGVLVCVDESELLATLQNVRQHLKPGGEVVVRAIVAINEPHTVSNKIREAPDTLHYSFYRLTDDYVAAFGKIGMRLTYANDMAPMDFITPLYRRWSLSSKLTPVIRGILSIGFSAQLLINPFLLRHNWTYRSLRDRLYRRKTVLLIFQ